MSLIWKQQLDKAPFEFNQPALNMYRKLVPKDASLKLTVSAL